MKPSRVAVVLLLSVAGLSPAQAQPEEPPVIVLTVAERFDLAQVEADSEVGFEEDTTSLPGPFPYLPVIQEQSGMFFSFAAASAHQATDISAFSIHGSGEVSGRASVGGNEEASVEVVAESNLFAQFQVPIGTPYTLTGTFTATGPNDQGVCSAVASVTFGVFVHDQTFDCLSADEEAAFFFTGTTVDADQSISVLARVDLGDQGLVLLGNAAASFEFTLDFGDRDGDGLLDSWEKNGIDFDGVAPPDIDLPSMGADPDVKDLFVEVDVAAGAPFDPATLLDVEGVFATARASDVDNADDSAGIRLHTFIDGDEPPIQEIIIGVGGTLPSEFYATKDTYFGSAVERSHPNWDEIRAARLRIFRYCLVVAKVTSFANGSNPSGFAEAIPSNDFVVSGDVLNWFSGPTTAKNALAATFMHELGHTLGLRHAGGAENSPQYKPNYLSVMNYAYQLPKVKMTNQGTNALEAWRLDYSRKAMATIDELALIETVSPNGPQGRMILYNSAPEGSPSKLNIEWADAPEVDWNFADGIESDPYFLDITRFMGSNTSYHELHSSSDWDRLWYHLYGDFNFDDRQPWPFAAPAEIGIDEETYLEILEAEFVDHTALGDLVFANGFELGSTTAWSDTVP